MKQKISKAEILEFLKEHKLAVLSTVNTEGLPDAAPIFFLVNSQFSFQFVTPVKTKKFINLQHQNQVLLTITDEERQETVQVRGVAREEEGVLVNILPKLARRLNGNDKLEMNLPLLKHKNQKKTVVVIEPTEIRMRKYRGDELVEDVLTFE